MNINPMNCLLTLVVYLKEGSSINLNKLLINTFKTEPKETLLPISGELIKEIEKQYGTSTIFKLTISAPSFQDAVFDLLIQLETLGIDWKFRGPKKISSDKYTFVASLFKEHGTFYQGDLNGITAILDEQQ